MDWQTMAERMDTATAADLGLTPLADPATAPEWLLAERAGMTDAQRARLAALRLRHLDKRHWTTPPLKPNNVNRYLSKTYWFYGRNPADGLAEIVCTEGWGYRVTLEWRPESFTMPGRQTVPGYGRTVREAYHDAWQQKRLWAHDKRTLLRRLREATEGTQRLLLQAEVDRRELREQVADWQAHAALEDEAVRQRDIARAAADEAQQETARLLRELDRAGATIEAQGELITDLREGVEVVRATLRDYGYTSGTLLERLETMHREYTVLRQHVDAQSGAHFRPSPPPAA